jgi:NTE family protein
MRNCIYSAILLVFLLFVSDLSALAQSPINDTVRHRPKVGLVMSGGGAKGWAYIGLLKVMHEAGLEVDYVAGSSAGSIVGAMYALGYHPDTMISIIKNIDWDNLLVDNLERKYIAYEEKEYGESYIIDLQIQKKNVGLKASMYEGQVINLMLNRIYSPAYKIHDFNKLQTPFLCMGTDLINGDPVVLDKGYLPMAIRSSMSIPAYFSPTYYNDKYIVDGGVVNNYPVGPVKKRGVEYVIGADVQQGKDVHIEDLNSIPAVLDHIIGFYRKKANDIGYNLTDLYIHYPMPYGTMDFDDYDSIIALGERVAREHYDEIKKLADSLNAIEFKPVKTYSVRPLDSVYIDDIVIEGNGRISTQYFEHAFGKYRNSWVKLDELEEKINMEYGSKFFDHLFYELQYDEQKDKTYLILKVKEASIGYLSVGAHYDNNYSVSLLLKGQFRNVVGKNTKIFTDLALGPNTRFRTLFLKDNGSKPGYGAKIEIYTLDFDIYDPYDISRKAGNYRYTNFKGSLFTQAIINNKFWFRLGGNYEYFRFKSKYEDGTDSISDYNSYGNIYFSFNSDTRDRPYLSKKGMKTEIRAEYVIPISSDWIQEIFNNSLVVWFNYNQNIPLSSKFTLKPGLFLGTTFQKGFPLLADNVNNDSDLRMSPAQYWFYMGGQSEHNFIHGFRPFTGVQFVQKYGMYQAILRMKLQYNVYKKLYVTFMGDVGANEWFMSDLFDGENIVVGYGTKLSYDSFIGPVELSIMGSNIYGVSFFINLGYSF